MGSVSCDTGLQIPIIDISGYLTGDKLHAARIAQELHYACRSPGFFQITGHSVSAELRSELLAKLAKFFALPWATKKELAISKSPCFRGYETVGEQTLEDCFKDQKEGFTIGNEDSLDDTRFLKGQNMWPDEGLVPGFREVFMKYFDELHKLTVTMFRLMALSLGLEEDHFDEFIASKDSISSCRAHRYPPTTPGVAAKTRGIGAHTDFGALTLLLQDDIGGLEVFHKPTQTWHPVKPVPGAFVVNIGDLMERWTNEIYTSTKHRVISPVCGRYRYSLAYFNSGLLDQMVECIPTCLEPGAKPLYEPVKVEDHLRKRYYGSY